MALFCFSGFALSVKAYGFASSPKGRAKSTAGSFLITPNTLAMSFTAWLSLRGKTSPAPGEDVTIGDKRGNLARERLRGRFCQRSAGAYQRFAGAALHQQLLPRKAGKQGNVAAPCREVQRLAVGIVEGKGTLSALRPCDLP